MADAATEAEERCAGCGREIRWIEAAMACPNGCVYCMDCASDTGNACSACGEHLRTRPARARPLPGR